MREGHLILILAQEIQEALGYINELWHANFLRVRLCLLQKESDLNLSLIVRALLQQKQRASDSAEGAF